jgi:uncharacterized membrane protein
LPVLLGRLGVRKAGFKTRGPFGVGVDEQVTPADRLLGCLAYLGPLVVVPLLVPKRHRFLFFHTRQGLYLFATWLVLMIPLLGLFYLFNDVNPVDVLKRVLAVLVALVTIVYAVTSLVLAAATIGQKMLMVPVLGEFAGER